MQEHSSPVQKCLSSRRGICGGLLCAIAGTIVFWAIVFLLFWCSWLVKGSSEWDQDYDFRRVLGDAPKTTILIVSLLGAAGFISFWRRPFRRLLRVIALLGAGHAIVLLVAHAMHGRRLKLEPDFGESIWDRGLIVIPPIAIAVAVAIFDVRARSNALEELNLGAEKGNGDTGVIKPEDSRS